MKLFEDGQPLENPNGKIDDFIKDHEANPKGDLDKLDAVIKRPAQETASKAPKASSQDASDD